ncbi:MAG: CDP-glycerol glycerophosphotransferase family protein [Clostridia bacterium]|jgi:CDP-ribitol ribitolphosphotransferase|nr:CDP-glycerol glycerophosphotransferase family protein [Clostridia bacterium]
MINSAIKITSLRWDNIYIKARLDGEYENAEFAIADKGGRSLFPMDYFDPETGELTVNVTNVGGARMLTNGVWYLKYRVAGDDWRPVPISMDVGYCLKDMDKVYRYAGTCYACVFTFVPVKEQEELIFEMTFTYMTRNDNIRKRNFRVEAPKLRKRIIKKLILFLENSINLVYQIASHITPKNGTRVLLMSESRCPINGNLKALDDRIRERGLDKSRLKMSYWFVKTLEDDSGFKILWVWLRLAFITARQDYIFVDDYSTFFNNVKLNPKTTLVQVWHAGVGFKAVGYARFGKKGTPNPWRCCYRQLDYAIVGGEFLREVYAEVFGIDRERCLPYGLMRLDNYLDAKKVAVFRRDFYDKNPDWQGRKIILFAPTFRGPSQRTAYYPYEMLDWDKIYDFCGDEYLFVIKQHPFIMKPVEIESKYAGRIIDFSGYPDINELFYVTDILITDYSSNIYEFSLHRKPMLFFAFDKEEYELMRGLHRTLDRHAPGKVCRTTEELLEAIRTGDFEMERLYRFVKENFDNTDGMASDKVIDNIILKDK